LDIVEVSFQKVGNISGRTVSGANQHYLGRRSVPNAEAAVIFVFGYDNEIMLLGIIPYSYISSLGCHSRVLNMGGSGIKIRELLY
jgi:hypothetical protein